MRHLLDTLGGLYQLARLAVITGFRFRGPYWQWRMHTAYSHQRPPRATMLHDILNYARWVHQMRQRM
jgi:hypothetical protein